MEHSENAVAEVADQFTVEQLWMLYGLAAGEVTTRERAEREAFSDLDSRAWIGVRAKLRYLIEVNSTTRASGATENEQA